MPKKETYKEIKYVVGFDPTELPGKIMFFPMIELEGYIASRVDNSSYWEATRDDLKGMSVAYGAAQSECDQLNAELQSKGLNRLREAS